MVTGFSGTPRVIFSKTIDVGNITAATCKEVTVTGVPGLMPNMVFLAAAPSLEANLNIGVGWGTAVGTGKFRITNPTAGDIDPASQEFYLIGF